MKFANYELEHVYLGPDSEDDCLGYVSMLTGYELKELRSLVAPRLLKSHGWYTRDFRITFEQLNFNTSARFIKFDADTDKPCLVRYKLSKRGIVTELQAGGDKQKMVDWWNVMVYNQGMLYCVDVEKPFPLKNLDPHFRITSMMPVWISDISTVPESWRK